MQINRENVRSYSMNNWLEIILVLIKVNHVV